MTEPSLLENKLAPGTQCVHAGQPVPTIGQPFLPGPVLAAAYHLTGEPALGTADIYGRNGNPTTRALEAAIGALDGGRALVFGSGMAAIAALLTTVLRRGDVVVVPADGYFVTRKYLAEQLAALDLEVRALSTTDPEPDYADARLVVLETPANPSMDVCDIRALADRAHAAGALVAVDNTTPSPIGQQPLALGADIVVASDSKALTGHSDVLAGHISTRDDELHRKLLRTRTLSGNVISPFDAWLTHRSLGTLSVRLDRQSANAASVVEELLGHGVVRQVRWPGHPGDPSYPLARRQMRRFGGLLTARFPDAETADAFIGGCRLVHAATSFGGLHSTADRRAQWGDPVDPGLVRISVGCEEPRDLVIDIRTAIARL
ncbi:cystathionine gamma-lyase [Pseudonocardiaceae bacterium YIM PH 21723]|nr:cystathionine gamma-lyase [Pseudonocardiaceae bacterium YIM PH 21723]